MRPAHLDEPTLKKKRSMQRRKHKARGQRGNYERLRNIMRNNMPKACKGWSVQAADSMIRKLPFYIPLSRKNIGAKRKALREAV